MFSEAKSSIIIFWFQIKIGVKTIFIFFSFKLHQKICILYRDPWTGPTATNAKVLELWVHHIICSIYDKDYHMGYKTGKDGRSVYPQTWMSIFELIFWNVLLYFSDWKKEQPPTPVQNQNVLAPSQHIPRAEPPPKKLRKYQLHHQIPCRFIGGSKLG